jgi:hypothetical protein
MAWHLKGCQTSPLPTPASPGRCALHFTLAEVSAETAFLGDTGLVAAHPLPVGRGTTVHLLDRFLVSAVLTCHAESCVSTNCETNERRSKIFCAIKTDNEKCSNRATQQVS